MKNLLLTLLLFSSTHSFAQSRADYERMMDRIVKCYNEKQFDKMRKFLSVIQNSIKMANGIWTNGTRLGER
jgi:hypothetical protein